MMLIQALLAAVELGVNRVLALDATALPRLGKLAGKVIAVECTQPALRFYLLPSADVLRLAGHWEAPADCTLRAPAGELLRLALARDKTAVLHGPKVDLDGDSGALLALAGILQDLELDWEYELSRWLGPIGAHLFGSHLRGTTQWTRSSLASLQQNLADYLAEESRTLVGQREADARFAELDELKLALDRLDARIERLAQGRESGK
jgi:ubiquinone biosynthesis protein UbiJ